MIWFLTSSISAFCLIAWCYNFALSNAICLSAVWILFFSSVCFTLCLAYIFSMSLSNLFRVSVADTTFRPNLLGGAGSITSTSSGALARSGTVKLISVSSESILIWSWVSYFRSVLIGVDSVFLRASSSSNCFSPKKAVTRFSSFSSGFRKAVRVSWGPVFASGLLAFKFMSLWTLNDFVRVLKFLWNLSFSDSLRSCYLIVLMSINLQIQISIDPLFGIFVF